MESMRSRTADYRPVNLNDRKWSPAEKGIARKAFNGALQRELDSITQEVKRRASVIKVPAELWELEEYLSNSRKEINRKYDYRFSVLPIVFGQLVREGRVSIDELRGLADDKVAFISGVAELRRE